MSLTQEDLQDIRTIVAETINSTVPGIVTTIVTDKINELVPPMIQTAVDAAIDTLAQQTAAGFAEVDQKFALIDERFAAIDRRFDQIDERFEKMDKRLNNLETDMAEVKFTLRTTNAYMQNVGGAIEEHGARLDRLEKHTGLEHPFTLPNKWAPWHNKRNQ